MNNEIQQRLVWIKLFKSTGDAGLVCRRCGISRPKLRKWLRRYQKNGESGLVSESRRPKSSPNKKVTSKIEQIILELRTTRYLGARRLQSELSRLHDIQLSLATIHKVLKRNDVKDVVKFRRKVDFIRYERPLPGDRVQMDTCKLAPGLYQYTSVDDCTRYRVNTLGFIDAVVEEMPFPIQRFQTDRGN